MANKAIKSVELEKIRLAAEQFLLFVRNEGRLKELDLPLVQDIENKLKTLFSNIDGQRADEVKAGEIVETLIDSANARLISNKNAPLFPNFPQILPINQVQNHIIAFELILNQYLRLEKISLEKEAPLFSKAMVLWRDVGIRRTLKEAMVELANLIGELNSFLPEEDSHPYPSPELY